MTVSYEKTKAQLLDAILVHVAFEGWSLASFQAAIRDADVSPAVARAVCPRGAVDLAMAYHQEGDRLMVERLQTEDLTHLRFREQVAALVRFRLEVVTDKEAVRRGVTLFALPIHAADGARLIWGTADLIWQTLGDTSDDLNWYTKRATLCGVYSSTVLYWLGDDSAGSTATWEFLDRRIDEVMQIEKLKSKVRESPVLSRLMAGPEWLASQIKAPRSTDGGDLPGRWSMPGDQG